MPGTTDDEHAPQPLAMPLGVGVLATLPRIEAALEGRGPALVPYAADAPPPQALLRRVDPETLPDGLALCVGTSGSTGVPKGAMLTADAIRASVAGSEAVLGGPGRWLLTLPPHHIAGLQVLIRSMLASHVPAVLDLTAGFSTSAFVDATTALLCDGAERHYTSLVPTQLSRVLDDPAATRALAGYDAVLIGGAATSPSLVDLATDAGVRVVLSYGSSETAGGCVYDGYALPGAQVHLDNEGHVVLGGATLAHGYLGHPVLTAAAFSTDADGVRWFRTDDLGEIVGSGRLRIRGRADDLINTGGFKVAPGPVEDALVRFVEGVQDAVVVGVPHPEWGEAVSAALTTYDGARPTLEQVRAAIRGVVPDHALPQAVMVLDALPMRGPGKPDRSRIATGLTAIAADGGLGWVDDRPTSDTPHTPHSPSR